VDADVIARERFFRPADRASQPPHAERATGWRLAATVCEIDTVARYGGDEFVVVLGGLSNSHEEMKRQALVVAEKIRAALSHPCRLLQKPGQQEQNEVSHLCSSNIGITLFHGNTDTQDAVLNRGDTAMYRTKEAGRDQIDCCACP